MIVNDRIAGTRITVWDVLHHLENGWNVQEIAEVLNLSKEQVEAAVRHIDANRTEVTRVHEEIERRNAQGNSLDVDARLRRARANRVEWLKQRQLAVTPYGFALD